MRDSQNIHEAVRPNPSSNLLKFNTKSMLEEAMPKLWNPAGNHQNMNNTSIQNSIDKLMRKKGVDLIGQKLGFRNRPHGIDVIQ